MSTTALALGTHAAISQRQTETPFPPIVPEYSFGFRALYVDAHYAGSEPSDGSVYAPFTTIQAAIDTVPAAASAAEMRLGPWQINIASGTYDEDLVVPIDGRRWEFNCYGTVNLGVFDAAGWQPSTRRNLTLTGSLAAIDGISPTFSVYTVAQSTPRSQTLFGFRVGGRIDASGVTGSGTYRVALEHFRIFGDATSQAVVGPSGFGTNVVGMDFSSGLVSGTLTGNLTFGTGPATCTGVSFAGAFNIRSLVGAFQCAFAGAITTNVSATMTGLFACTFSAGLSYTTAVGQSVVVDTSTYLNMRNNNVTLVTGTYSTTLVKPTYDYTNTPTGTTGAQIINKASGTVNFAAAATSLVVTCNLCTINSLVYCTLRTGGTAAVLGAVVPAAGSFTINLAVAAAVEVSVGFLVVNQ